jgi:hypothetical protein
VAIAESNERGFIITGDDVPKITADNPCQPRRLAAVSSLIDARLGAFRDMIDLRRTQGLMLPPRRRRPGEAVVVPDESWLSAFRRTWLQPARNLWR